jgi:hypothetical protein
MKEITLKNRYKPFGLAIPYFATIKGKTFSVIKKRNEYNDWWYHFFYGNIEVFDCNEIFFKENFDKVVLNANHGLKKYKCCNLYGCEKMNNEKEKIKNE